MQLSRKQAPGKLAHSAPPSVQALAPLGLWTGALAALRSLRGWGRGRRVCARVHLAQPFSLQVWTPLGKAGVTWGLSWGFWQPVLEATAGIALPTSGGLCADVLWARANHLRALSWQEYTINARSCWDSRQTLEQLLQPIVLGQW